MINLGERRMDFTFGWQNIVLSVQMKRHLNLAVVFQAKIFWKWVIAFAFVYVHCWQKNDTMTRDCRRHTLSHIVHVTRYDTLASYVKKRRVAQACPSLSHMYTYEYDTTQYVLLDVSTSPSYLVDVPAHRKWTESSWRTTDSTGRRPTGAESCATSLCER